jgi:hypothetical protein
MSISQKIKIQTVHDLQREVQRRRTRITRMQQTVDELREELQCFYVREISELRAKREGADT